MYEVIKIRVAINGFGRIGRVFLKALLERKTKGVEVVAINHTQGAESAAYLFQHDSVYGMFHGKVGWKKDLLIINGKSIKIVSGREPENLPWRSLKIDVVIESTGAFTDTPGASKHLIAGAKNVVITAPSRDNQCPTIIPGINDNKIKKSQKVFSLGSCTTNCLAPVVKILNDEFGIERAFFNTIHAYTNDQSLQDSFHRKTRRGRAAGRNIVPTNSGASLSVEQAIPELKNKLSGLAIRVPVICGSITDLTAELKKPFTIEKINATFKKHSQGKMKNILEYSEDELVSTDIIGNPKSSVIDGLSTMKDGNLVKVLAWYDNEYGYSNRLVDFLLKIK